MTSLQHSQIGVKSVGHQVLRSGGNSDETRIDCILCAASIKHLIETKPFGRPRRIFDQQALQSAFSWSMVQPANTAARKPVNAKAIHLSSTDTNRGQTLKEARRVSAPIPRGKRPRSCTPTPSASPSAAAAGGSRAKRGRDDDDDDYTPGGSSASAPKTARSASHGNDTPAASPRTPRVYVTPELSPQQKHVLQQIASSPEIQLSDEQAKHLAMNLELRHDTLVAKLQPVFNRAVNELIRWKPRGGDNWFKYKITPKWAREHAPDYLHRIAHPMDLIRIRGRTTSKNPDDMYCQLAEFETDIRLIFSNCKEYNGEDSPITATAAQMVNYFYNKQFNKIVKELQHATEEAKLSELQRLLTSMRAEHIKKQQAAETGGAPSNAPSAAAGQDVGAVAPSGVERAADSPAVPDGS